MIDTVLIATHGHIGQVWLGSAKDIWANNLCAWVLGAADEGKGFASPGAFGTLLKNLFGTRLAIGIYACNFADAPGGDTVAMEIRGAAEARVLVAGKADVYFKIPASGQRPVAECNGAVAFYTEKTIEIGSKQIPIFPI